MIDITPLAVAIVTVGLPLALAYGWAQWQKWKDVKDSPAWIIEREASRAVKLAQDLKDTGIFDEAIDKGAAALAHATSEAMQEIEKHGVKIDVLKVQDACRIAYQEFKKSSF